MADSELLVALLKEKSDFAILKGQGWYRIPVEHIPKRWPPEWLAFYQPSAFKEDAFLIRYFGRIEKIEAVTRRTSFPNEIENTKSDKQYFRIKLEKLEERQQPIPSRFPRRVIFIPTTLEKFHHAEQINDLFDESLLEDELWLSLKSAQILAERQWEIKIQKYFYQLDFAVFCNEGQIDIEADGDTWHARRERIDRDNNRNNSLASAGWQVLRFNGKQIRENQAKYCLGKIENTINNLGGLSSDGLVPRKFYPEAGGAQQLSLFEEQAEYDVNLD
jgi:very-short-patch-repair endonuclease